MTDREKLLKIASWFDMYDLKTKGNVSDREVQSDLIRIAESLPSPTQDGTAEEIGEKNKVFYSALKYTHDLPIRNMKLFKSLAFEMMSDFAAPLRSEIERLKSELAASCSPNLVLPKSDTSNPVSEYWRGVKQGYNDCLTLVISLNPSLFK